MCVGWALADPRLTSLCALASVRFTPYEVLATTLNGEDLVRVGRLGRFCCGYRFCWIFRFIDVATNERDHVSGSLDSSEARIEHELCHTCRRLDLGLKNIRLQRVQKALLEQLGSYLIRHCLPSFDEHLVGDTLRLRCEDRHPDCREDIKVC